MIRRAASHYFIDRAMDYKHVSQYMISCMSHSVGPKVLYYLSGFNTRKRMKFGPSFTSKGNPAKFIPM